MGKYVGNALMLFFVKNKRFSTAISLLLYRKRFSSTSQLDVSVNCWCTYQALPIFFC